MIEVNSGPPGWVKFQPFDDDEDVKCEIKELTVEEGLQFTGMFIDGEIKGDIYGEAMREYFKSYVRNIEGIKLNGTVAKKPEDLLNPSVRRSGPIHDFYTTVMYEFIKINSIVKDEVKNSESLPGEDTEMDGVVSETESRS